MAESIRRSPRPSGCPNASWRGPRPGVSRPAHPDHSRELPIDGRRQPNSDIRILRTHPTLKRRVTTDAAGAPFARALQVDSIADVRPRPASRWECRLRATPVRTDGSLCPKTLGRGPSGRDGDRSILDLLRRHPVPVGKATSPPTASSLHASQPLVRLRLGVLTESPKRRFVSTRIELRDGGSMQLEPPRQRPPRPRTWR